MKHRENSVTLRVTLSPCFKKMIENDKVTEKKTFANLGTMGSADPYWDHCCVDVCAEEGDARVVATTSKGIKYACRIN